MHGIGDDPLIQHILHDVILSLGTGLYAIHPCQHLREVHPVAFQAFGRSAHQSVRMAYRIIDTLEIAIAEEWIMLLQLCLCLLHCLGIARLLCHCELAQCMLCELASFDTFSIRHGIDQLAIDHILTLDDVLDARDEGIHVVTAED